MVLVDCFETNICSIERHTKKCSVFYSTKTCCIDVYKLHQGQDGFLKTFQDSFQEQGFPSISKQDNAPHMCSKKVTDFNHEHLVRDVFSENISPASKPS